MKKRNKGLMYVTPWLIGLAVFTIYPFISSLILSFANYDIINPPVFIGFENYKKLFADPEFWNSITVTFKYVIMTVPLKLAVALLVAFVLNFKLKGVNFFRSAYYIPSILGGNVAIAVLWRFLFTTDGLINQILIMFGGDPIGWFSTPGGALFTLCLLRIWQFGSAMVIFLAALQDIPQDLYEAGSIDGASKLKMFFKITIPMITPTIFFNLIMQTVQAFQEFNGPYLITNGGPMKATYLMPMMIYENAFKYSKMGYASAAAWILFIIIMFFTMIVFKSSSQWVFYQDEADKMPKKGKKAKNANK